jgi:hypothetical protein
MKRMLESFDSMDWDQRSLCIAKNNLITDSMFIEYYLVALVQVRIERFFEFRVLSRYM